MRSFGPNLSRNCAGSEGGASQCSCTPVSEQASTVEAIFSNGASTKTPIFSFEAGGRDDLGDLLRA